MIINQFFHKDKSLLSPKVYEKIRNKKRPVSVRLSAGLRKGRYSKSMKKQAYNPYLPSWEYIPDGEPYVFNDRVYIYGSHDRFRGMHTV